MAYPLYLAKDPQQVSAENFVNIFRAVAAVEQGLRNFGQVCGGVNAFGRGAADPIKVRSQANVIHSRDFRDVVDVIDQRLKWRARALSPPFPPDPVFCQISDSRYFPLSPLHAGLPE